MVAPTFVNSVATNFGNATTPEAANLTGVQAGDLVIVRAAMENAAVTLNTPVAAGVTFTLLESPGAGVGDSKVMIWAGTATSTGTLNVSVSRPSGGQNYGFVASAWRGHGGVGAAESDSLIGAPSLSVTTTGNNSALLVIAADWNAADGGSRVWRTTAGAAVERTYYRNPSTYAVYAADHLDAGPAGSKMVGLSAQVGQDATVAVVEVLAGAGGGPSVVVASGVLPATVTVSSSASAVRALTGAVPLSAGLGSLSAAVMRATGTTPVTVALSGSAVRVAVAAGTLPLTIALASSSAKVTSATGAMSASLGMAGTTSSGTTTTGVVPLTIGLHGVSSRVAHATGTLPISVGLSGASLTDNTVTGTLPLHLTTESAAHMVAFTSGVLPGFIALDGIEHMRDITVTGTLTPQRWAATLPTRTRSAVLTPRRWEGQHD